MRHFEYRASDSSAEQEVDSRGDKRRGDEMSR
jgi:hypothetical protein